MDDRCVEFSFSCYLLLFPTTNKDSQKPVPISLKKKTAKTSKEETKEGTKEQLCYLTEIFSQLKI
jgi:hypothetical protein